MENVSYEDTCVANTDKRMTAREALLHDKYARLAAAKVALEEMYDDGDMNTAAYYGTIVGITRCMERLSECIEEERNKMEMLWPVANVDFNTIFIPHEDCIYEITRHKAP